MLTPRQETALRTAWHGKKSQHELAEQFDMSPRGVQKFWEREKASGRLPRGEARPHFAESTTLLCAAAPVAAAVVTDAEVDRSERIAEQFEQFNRAGSDQLAEALHRHHGGQVWRRNDDVEPRLLRREVDPFHAPGEAELADIARRRDFVVEMLADQRR